MKNLSIFPIFFILFLNTITVFSQSFESKGESPFGIQPINMVDTTRIAFKYIFKDMDTDGDLDLFLFGMDGPDTVSTNSELQNTRYFFEIQENIGNKWNPEFKAREKKFETFNFASGNSFFLPTIGDLNGDGRQDFVISAHADTNFIQNIRFDIQTSENIFETHLGSDYDLSNFSPGSIFLPELIDLDMDGDLDLLLSGGYSPLYEDEETIYAYVYAKNIGTPTDPNYLGWFHNPYGLKADTIPAFICGADMDMDGDIDILGVAQKDSLHVFEYYENKPGVDGRPLFSGSVSSPFGLPENKSGNEGFYFPSLVDLDGDGDSDLILPRIVNDTTFELDNTFTIVPSFRLDYFENTLCSTSFESLEEIICEGDTIFIDGKEYFESGSWVIETTNQNGCTKVVQLSIDVIPVNITFVNETLCYGDIYFLGDDPYTESGTYELSMMSVSGCDRTLIAELEFIQIEETLVTQKLCYGDTYENGGLTFNESGTYTINLESNMGCDSTIIFDLEFLQIDTTLVTQKLCLGDTYENGGLTFSESGTYEINLQSNMGCDSTILAELDFIQIDTTLVTQKLCLGDTYENGGQTFNESGTYEINLESIIGCDSTIKVELDFIQIDTTIVNQSLCLGEYYEIGDQQFYETGTYEVSLVSYTGCDSVIIASLDFIDIDPIVSLNGSVLTANNDESYFYQWIDCDSHENIDGAVNNIFEPIYSGNYAVIITDDIGCIDTSECNYVISSKTTSIFDENGINILPNPTTGLISLKNNSNKEIESIDLFGINGDFIKTFNSNQTKNMDISQMQNGIYFFKIKTKDKGIIVKQILLIN